ncbi:hypothetical protein [Fulvivirga ligni]|uniref:hypothetical protein n=1 Tax=Fulvivirga ligni TaxID=2904246 RepID=UPI001F1D0AFD|nr:hypothetical protein [Fulvivirga ligni]UII20727.1 hypothetical protein LVD16_23070 [Fulvivirga ligni]
MQKLFGFLIICTVCHVAAAQQTIPFHLGDDNRIYIQGLINQSDTLNLVFDLGADITVINKTKIEANQY